MTNAATEHRDGGPRTGIKKFALAMGVVFLLVGLMGFIPGLTSNVDELQFAGHHSEAKLLGLFQVSVLHNIVHLLFGIAGVVASRSLKGARLFLLVGGAVYLVLFLYGILVPHDSGANFVPLNGADNLLHLFLGVIMVMAGVMLSRSWAGQTAESGLNQGRN